MRMYTCCQEHPFETPARTPEENFRAPKLLTAAFSRSAGIAARNDADIFNKCLHDRRAIAAIPPAAADAFQSPSSC
jgi:hypothetical protein